MKPRILLLLCALLPGLCAAAESGLDLDVKTPAIEKIKSSLAARHKQITHWKDFGYIGEDMDGLLKVRSRARLSLTEKKELEDGVDAQNRDRRAWYREVLRAHGLPNDDRATELMRLMAKRQRQATAPGHFVVDPENGTWVKARDLEE